jgi:hypothetical protein
MDYTSIIKSIQKKTKGATNVAAADDDFAEFISEMKRSPLSKIGSSNITLFSDFYGEEFGEGKVAVFRGDKLKFDLYSEINLIQDGDNVKVDTLNLFRQYHKELIAKSEWLALMGIMERLLLQLESHTNPQIAYSTQKQKSGTNKFQYILLRAPFYDLLKGKCEIRIYFNKLEDYSKYKTIEELQRGDMNFISESRKVVQKKMKEKIDNNPVMFSDIKDALEKIESDIDRKMVSDHEIKRREWMKKHNFNKK